MFKKFETTPVSIIHALTAVDMSAAVAESTWLGWFTELAPF